MRHPARTIPFTELRSGLLYQYDNDNVTRQIDGDLEMYTYSKRCVYEKRWNFFTEISRGIILDAANDNVVATPFVKFWNYGERPEIPALPFEVFGKEDGSLIVIWWHDGKWRCSTKGSFTSDQAVAAQKFITYHAEQQLWRGCTYLAEYVGPSNRIVLQYEKEELILLGGYTEHGSEFDYALLDMVAFNLGWRVATRHQFDSFAHLVATAPTLPATQEGFVVRFANGYRLKVKGDEYCRLHRCISNVTPLAIWEAMVAGADMEAMRRELPEEFWVDFDFIRNALAGKVDAIVDSAKIVAGITKHFSDKELGIHLQEGRNADVRSYIFPLRKQGEAKVRTMALKAVRPTGNHLEGYRPSSAMQRVEGEA